MTVSKGFLEDYLVFIGESADAIIPLTPTTDADKWEYNVSSYPEIKTVKDALDKLFTLYSNF